MPDDQLTNAALRQLGFFIHSFGTSELCKSQGGFLGWRVRLKPRSSS
jgi:hypothetical protein